ncbi:MAG: hypothetical protein KDD25_08220 [Bdellovibrionales bacterium]|nr:hypothetical protein [Bdellovibrionales bacterium]
MKRLSTRLVLFFLLFSPVVETQAEYRAFRLEITDGATGKKREVVTSLDPFQYVGYFPVLKSESVYYTETWMCWESTSRRSKVCDNPKSKAEVQANPVTTN